MGNVRLHVAQYGGRADPLTDTLTTTNTNRMYSLINPVDVQVPLVLAVTVHNKKCNTENSFFDSLLIFYYIT